MFVNEKINQKKLLEFVQNFKSFGHLQQMTIYQEDELKLRFSVAPYDCSEIKQLFSISKSFTSMAIGKAVSENKLDVHDKIVDIFKDIVPINHHPNLDKMEIFHLLTMTTGHASCVMPQIGQSDDPLLTFLKLDVPYEPGTYFAYNTGASLILSMIINKITGMSVDEYLKPMFEDLNIQNYYFEKLNGVCLGGTGLHVNIDALTNLGIMLLNEGYFNGKEVINSEYVKEACKKQVNNSGSTIDWNQGYSYHLWQGCEGFRCDGAYGQLILVLPKRKMVIAVQAMVEGMQKEVDLIMDYINNLYGKDDVVDLQTKINDVYKIEAHKEFDLNLELNLEANKLGLEKIRLNNELGNLKLEFIGTYPFELLVGNGKYIKNSFKAFGIKAKLYDIMPSYYEESIVSCYYEYDDKLKIILKNHNTPLIQDFVFDFKEKWVIISNNKIIFN